MIMFAKQLAVLMEKALTKEPNESPSGPQLPVRQLEAKELDILKLEGKITHLEEILLMYQPERNKNHSKSVLIPHLQRNYDCLMKKYEHLKTRHSSLSSILQDSIREKDKEIVALKCSLRERVHAKDLGKNNNTFFESEMATSPSKVEYLLKGIEERNSLIDEMRIEIERKLTMTDEVDRIRLHYLEGIVHDLERKLAVATGSPLTSCKYGSISLYNVAPALSINSFDDKVTSHSDKVDMKEEMIQASDNNYKSKL